MTNKMILAIVPRDQTEAVLKALVKAGYTATFSDSRGGVLRQSQHMLFIAVPQKDVNRVLDIIRCNCRGQTSEDPGQSPSRFLPASTSIANRMSGTVIFVWDLEQLEVV